MAKVKTTARPSKQKERENQKIEPSKQKERRNSWIWPTILAFTILAVVLSLAIQFGPKTEKEVASAPIVQPTSLSLPSPETEAKPTSQPKPATVPTVAPTAIPIESWQAAIYFYLLTGTRETDAAEYARAYAKLNPSWAKEYAGKTLESLTSHANLSLEELSRFQRFAMLAGWFEPTLEKQLQAEMTRLVQEAEANQQAAQEAQTKPQSEIVEPEVPETVEINLAPPVSFPGIGFSPEEFQIAYKSLRQIPYESTWKVTRVKETPFPFFSFYDISFQRQGSGNPQTTWFKGIFLGKIKEGDIVSGKWMWENLWKKLFP